MGKTMLPITKNNTLKNHIGCNVCEYYSTLNIYIQRAAIFAYTLSHNNQNLHFLQQRI